MKRIRHQQRPIDTALGVTLQMVRRILRAADAIAGDMPECSSADPRRVLISHDRKKWEELQAAVDGQIGKPRQMT